MALIPPKHLDCVVAIGFDNDKGFADYAATGFLYGKFFSRSTEGINTYNIYLVTNRHVLDGKKQAVLKFNPEGGNPAREFTLDLIGQNGKPIWFIHDDPEIDLAIISVDMAFLKKEGIQCNYFHSDAHSANKAKLIEIEASEGDGVFVLGFPMGIVGKTRNYVIVKQGILARIKDRLFGDSKEILIDASIYPGNSGSPVVIKPEFVAIQGTKPIPASLLIGVVSEYIPYRDVAVSLQTKQPRIIFEENSGLAVIIPIDYVDEIIEKVLNNNKTT